MMAMGNREQHVESDLIVEEVELINNMKRVKEKFRELVKKDQEMKHRDLME